RRIFAIGRWIAKRSQEWPCCGCTAHIQSRAAPFSRRAGLIRLLPSLLRLRIWMLSGYAFLFGGSKVEFINNI
ncbi:hypothetical protein, partial [uncultured Desulfovibrio sp.]|uniref:hypothetical protein n=1 Tax=uncultured Desulfovibrio sp. TaxID=167968 RepID=UPI00266F6666